MENTHIDIEPGIPGNAVSIYGQNDAMDDFPVLKAFQQYIDAEHAKARKRLISLGIFFGIFTGIIIAIFVALLMNVSARNQALNDRLIEFAMKDRDRGQAAVVVQPPVHQDNSALIAVTAKLEALQKKLEEKDRAKANVPAVKVEEKPKGPTEAELEVVRLKALLSAEKEKLAEEKKRQKELELEAYRRKHYPELYEDDTAEKRPRPAIKQRRKIQMSKQVMEEKDDIDELIEDIDLDADNAISYFDDDEEELPRRRKKRRKSSSEADRSPSREYYSIPVEIKGTKSTWTVPNE